MKKIKILCLFDYACTTGFHTVSHNIIAHLKKHFRDRLQLKIVAINYYGEAFWEDANTYVMGASKIDPKDDVYGRNAFMKMVRYEDYDIVFIIQDIELLNMLGDLYKMLRRDMIKENKKQPKLMAYFPIDSPPLEEFVTHLDVYDTLVTYTEYGRRELHKIRPSWKTRIRVIPHGNNPKNFYPIDRERTLKFRKDYFGGNADKYIISAINRNQPRKDIPNTIFSFLEYKKNFNQDSFLYLHMNARDPLGWNLERLMCQTGLANGHDYMFLDEAIKDHGASIDMMNHIYNASDVLLSTTLGEGWGLTISEAFACRLPVVAPLHTSLSEIGDDGGRLWGCQEFIPVATSWDNIIRDRVDYREVAEMIEECRTNTVETKKKTDNAFQYISSLSWERVCHRWNQEFDNLL